MGNFIARLSSVVRPDPLKGQNIFRFDEIMGETHIMIASAFKKHTNTRFAHAYFDWKKDEPMKRPATAQGRSDA